MARRTQEPFVGCASYPACHFTEAFQPALAAALQAYREEIAHLRRYLADIAAERDYWKAHAHRPAAPTAGLPPAAISRDLKKLLSIAHPDRWSANQPAEALAHELTVAVNAWRARLEVAS